MGHRELLQHPEFFLWDLRPKVGKANSANSSFHPSSSIESGGTSSSMIGFFFKKETSSFDSVI